MAVFQSEQEIYEILGAFFENVKEGDVAKKILQSYQPSETHDALVQFVYTKPEAKITWIKNETGDGIDIICGETNLNPELKFEMNADIGHKFWSGKVELSQALARQQMTAHGPLSKSLKVVPHLQGWFPLYKEHLIEVGREDLVG
ncbi:hypothetical protein [Alkalihalobacterium elongatum]|uniref:hypothetical protein n=1 Tax=Alkalihalobacterium elongatum TaxID=2675466 RepID=UPI001C20058E|nr:hypothetical protein [Alkalihalobacterium elongatum]